MSAVRLSIEGEIATLVMSRSESMNSMSMEFLSDFNAALDQFVEARPRLRCLILTGSGRAFCSGGDISAHRDRPVDVEPYDLGRVLSEHFNPLLLRLLRLPAPIVTAVNGMAAGAGCPLALAGDIVLAARGASFECGFMRIGLIPDLGATWLLPRLIGRSRAHAMMLLDERVSAERAAAWGMIHACVDDEALAQEAMTYARRLAAGPTEALVETRRAILEGGGASLLDALDHEASVQRRMGFSADMAEGITAFFARRAPHFGGGG